MSFDCDVCGVVMPDDSKVSRLKSGAEIIICNGCLRGMRQRRRRSV